MKRSVSRKILLMLSVLGIMVIFACVLNASALKFVAGYNVSVETEVENLKAALEGEGATLIDVILPPNEDVLPMVAPGAQLDNMVLGE